jgi:CheY-like chemotaxis protein
LIAAPGQIEASLVAHRLASWGAATCVVSDQHTAISELSRQAWDTVIVDSALGAMPAAAISQACPPTVLRRLALVTPQTRDQLPALKQQGFTGYLVKPVRTASLAARFGNQADTFERSGDSRAATEDAKGAASARGLSILVAEDNEINALLARALLVRLGHRPTIAATGTDAVESFIAARAAGKPYDLVLMDVHMPGVDGLAAARSIRDHEADTGTPHTRIVALTANVTAEERDACLAAGMDGFLTKPLDRDRLMEALASAKAAALAA